MGVFVRYGYRLTSMELVGQEAGLTRQALYHHFKSKESLFLAVIETLMAGAHEAASAAGLEQEQAGAGLAETLIAMTAARWRYYTDSVKDSGHAEELLSEHKRQSQALNETYAAEEQRLLVEAIDRFRGRGVELKAGMTSGELARCIRLTALGAKAGMTDPAHHDALPDLECAIGLLIAGALVPNASNTQSNHGRS